MKMDRPNSGPSRSSILGLDALTFLMADVRDGVGPYLSIYLKGGLHWQSGEIGIAMAVSSITAAICQIPAGLLVDSVRAKRLLVVISGIMVGIGSLLVVCLPKLAVIVGAQATLGAASAVIPPALAALSLGIVGRKLFPARVSRNESFNHGVISPPPSWRARSVNGSDTNGSSFSFAFSHWRAPLPLP